jgi:hypothetical protein
VWVSAWPRVIISFDFGQWSCALHFLYINSPYFSTRSEGTSNFLVLINFKNALNPIIAWCWRIGPPTLVYLLRLCEVVLSPVAEAWRPFAFHTGQVVYFVTSSIEDSRYSIFLFTGEAVGFWEGVKHLRC